jgi:hypothetical protein
MQMTESTSNTGPFFINAHVHPFGVKTENGELVVQRTARDLPVNAAVYLVRFGTIRFELLATEESRGVPRIHYITFQQPQIEAAAAKLDCSKYVNSTELFLDIASAALRIKRLRSGPKYGQIVAVLVDSAEQQIATCQE